jgi:hypothetical protein
MRKGYPASLSNQERDYLPCRSPDLPKTLRIRTHTLREIFDAIV